LTPAATAKARQRENNYRRQKHGPPPDKLLTPIKMRDWIRRLATFLVTVFSVVIVEPFIHVNIETLAKEHHWDNELTKLLSSLPDLSAFLDSGVFWFFFGHQSEWPEHFGL
jgi:hypothetical protein